MIFECNCTKKKKWVARGDCIELLYDTFDDCLKKEKRKKRNYLQQTKERTNRH